jgi:hypothetical protein
MRLCTNLVFAALAAVSIAIPAPGLAQAQPQAPAALQPPAGQTLVWRAPAVGVQIYRCQAGNAGPAWTFVGPEAVLLDGEGRVIGTHFGGPSWMARDGSRVVGARVEGADAANPASIPWLLLRVTQRDGAGVLANVASIQRLYTAGGVAPPAGECTAARVGSEARVDYTAYYFFYRSAN